MMILAGRVEHSELQSLKFMYPIWYRCGTGYDSKFMNQNNFDKSLDSVPKLLQIKSPQALIGIIG